MPKKAALSAAVVSLAAKAAPALAVVDERLNGDGTGLIFGINDESLGFILHRENARSILRRCVVSTPTVPNLLAAAATLESSAVDAVALL